MKTIPYPGVLRLNLRGVCVHSQFTQNINGDFQHESIVDYVVNDFPAPFNVLPNKQNLLFFGKQAVGLMPTGAFHLARNRIYFIELNALR